MRRGLSAAAGAARPTPAPGRRPLSPGASPGATPGARQRASGCLSRRDSAFLRSWLAVPPCQGGFYVLPRCRRGLREKAAGRHGGGEAAPTATAGASRGTPCTCSRGGAGPWWGCGAPSAIAAVLTWADRPAIAFIASPNISTLTATRCSPCKAGLSACSEATHWHCVA